MLAMAQALAPAVAMEDLSDLVSRLDPDFPADWRNLAALVALARSSDEAGAERARIVAISGGQGAGKSTFAAVICQAHECLGKHALSVSLDDFYLTKTERQQLALDVHPLLATRGVPGTHDVDLALSTLKALRKGERTSIPVFDKGLDDRLPPAQWIPVDKPVEVIVFEGWCLGAQAQVPLVPEPINSLERSEDPDGVWRSYVNRALTRYEALWELVNFWIYLAVPDIQSVIRWRTQQEQNLPETRRMQPAAIERFVAHYQRLTLQLLRDMPDRADWKVELAADHSVSGVTSKR
jgi:D-glycerate 3-kinase